MGIFVLPNFLGISRLVMNRGNLNPRNIFQVSTFVYLPLYRTIIVYSFVFQ